MDTYAIVTEKIINLLEQEIGLGAQLGSRAISAPGNPTEVSIISCCRPRNSFRPFGSR
jgi:hypothetical protein